MRAYKAIAAMAENRVIGLAGSIPWRLPGELAWFKQATWGGVLVMGRRTFQSIGRPLPGRRTVVLTRSSWSEPGVDTAPDVESLEGLLRDEPRAVWVAGGAEVYSQLLPRCDDLYLTRVAASPQGDTFFPPFEDRFFLVGEAWRGDGFVVEHLQTRTRWLA